MTQQPHFNWKNWFNMNGLLLLIPLTVYLEKSDASPTVVFLFSAFAIIPLSKLIGESTEALADYFGPTIGGLLNASLGNAPEIIIGFFALKAGLIDMVKASITGSIIGNLLIGMGLAFIAYGSRNFGKVIKFNYESYQVHSGLLTLAIFGLIIPAIFDFTTVTEREISLEIAVVLFILYILSVMGTFFPTAPRQDRDDALEILRIDESHEQHAPKWSKGKAFAILTAVTITLAYMSEIMTDAITPATAALGLTPMFSGIFILALLGNASELINGVHFARTGQLELALGIFLGGSAQMALLVAPALVFLGYYLEQNMNLLFCQYELIALIMTVIAVSKLLGSGQVKPRVGLGFISLYIMLGIGFYYAP